MIFDNYTISNRYRKNPLLSQFSSSVPTDIKDMFKWMEFIIFNAPVASSGLKKLSETPITSFRYSTNGDTKEASTTQEESWKNIIEKDLQLKAVMIDISYNTMLYGNQFVSVYTPFSRFLVCSGCSESMNIERAKGLQVKLRTNNDRKNISAEEKSNASSEEPDLSKMYKGEKTNREAFLTECFCMKCKKKKEHKILDVNLKESTKINVIRWNPYNIEIAENKVSGNRVYYYRPEPSLMAGVKQGDPEILNALPVGMIEAILKNKVFRFAPNQIFHLRRETISGASGAWGMPALAASIPAFLNTMILRRANEKIASDYMVPMRVMYPTQSNTQGEIYNYISGGDFVGKINNMIDKWKIDPSAVQTAPFPIGVQNVLGDGKMLSVHQELEMAESSIANSLGIPLEFIKGGLSYAGQGASLRLLENQMGKIISSLNECIDFIVKKTASALGKEPITIDMIPFKIIDDLQEKATIVQLAAQGAGISKGTLMEIFNMDAKEEEKRIVQENKDDIVNQLESQKFQQDRANSIEERVRAEENMSKGSFQSLNQSALLQEADMQAQQLSQMDHGQRKSALDEMSKTNYILYSVVKARMEMADNKQKGGQQEQQ